MYKSYKKQFTLSEDQIVCKVFIDKGGLYFQDYIPDYKYIIKTAEKYISKTIYKTFSKKDMEENLKIDFNNLQVKDLFAK